jgi:hypothetical protein
LTASVNGCGMGGVIARSGSVVVGLHVVHRTRFRTISSEYKEEMLQMQVFRN